MMRSRASRHNFKMNKEEKFAPYKRIVPAVMASDFADLEEKIERVKGLVERVQIDVMDGRFTDSVSWPYKHRAGMHSSDDTEANLEKNFIEMKNEVKGLPCWEDFDFEVDLMVLNPAKAVEHWASIGVSCVILHLRDNNMDEVSAAIDVAESRGVNISVAILPEPLSPVLHDFIFGKEKGRITGIQCMGIDHVGHQREPFDVHDLILLQALRTEIDENNLDLVLSVDGGVSFKTAPSLFDAGADYLVAGSAIYDADSVHQALDHFADISGE
jgi:ribulose-phosphate 3-epimerase